MTLIPSKFYYNSGTQLKDVKMSDPDLIISSECLEIYGNNKRDYCFLQCKDTLKSFSFQPNPKLVTIGPYAFYNCIKLERIDLSSCTMLTSIKTYAFCQCTSVTELLLPKGLQYIMQFAFSNLKIQTVTIPASVLKIYDHGIADMTTLTSIIFKEGSKLDSLSNNAFFSTKLTEFKVPESVSSIMGTFLNGVRTMRTINVHQNNKFFVTSDSCAVYTKDYRVLSIFAASSVSTYVIDSRCTSINYGAFISCQCTSITIPSSVTQIGGYAFCGSSNIKQITLPPSITRIEASCFSGSGLTSIDIPDKVKYIGAYAFSLNTFLKTVLLPENLTEVGGGAFPSSNDINFTFKGNSSITIDNQMLMISKDNSSISMLLKPDTVQITLPIQTKEIKSSAFSGKKSLTTIKCDGISEIDTIGDYAFFSCTSLKSIPYFPKLKTIGIHAFSYTILSSEFLFPESFTSLGEYSFSNIVTLPSISFASTAKTLTISNYAFFGCTSLSRASFDECTSNISLGMNVFTDCSSLIMFRVSSHMKSIDSGCLMNCGIRTITFENSETSFDSLPSMFMKGCTNIEEILIPNNIVTIGTECFSGTSIRTIKIPDSVESLLSNCFSGCQSLEHVDISSTCNLASISPAIFEQCTSLSYISDFVSSKFVCQNSTIYDSNFKSVYLHAPTCKDNYISFDRRLVKVEESAFINSAYIEFVVFVDNSVVSIGKRAFESCTRLKQISIPSSVTFIGEDAFTNCESLRCGVLFQNKSKQFVEYLLKSGLPKSAILRCEAFSCIVNKNSNFAISLTLIAVFILM
ncbi:surface antigen BspA-like [Trichomonas vaginalis G3]|uniref:Surface antigen BspA-like n=1 Tax=Trichomonas vaginalis (strain ATCC PRA-98 / G3) TaxID=412133 RepID=A2DYC2_TRIV3|nr:regulation of response to stimulus [Trichomonas vaginalis G3]EAY14599.1 surface antigen BspA-like [Trichomonas vaginalis G3]KAI5526610.1 regulation of response to stimulus [Trichomonas vaginalis G3]|eukprot:XP_001326822.1 surface antigen BspA-like [Trichomonas vaginalis G3]